jgi:hypothetical protein
MNLSNKQRLGLAKIVATNFASDYFTDAEAQDLLGTLDPGGRLLKCDEVADQLEENEWYGPAGDLRDGVNPDTIINRIQEMTDDEDELARAIPLLASLAED